MRGSAEVAKGRVEEAAGALVNNDKLRAKGQADQSLGRVMQASEVAVRQAKDEARKVVDQAKDAAKQAVDKAKGGA